MKSTFWSLVIFYLAFSSCTTNANNNPNQKLAIIKQDNNKKAGDSFTKQQTEEYLIKSLSTYRYGRVSDDKLEEYFDYKFEFLNDNLVITYSVGTAPNKAKYYELFKVPVNTITSLQYNSANTELLIMREDEGINGKGYSITNTSSNITRYKNSFIAIPFWIQDANDEKMMSSLNNALERLQKVSKPEEPF